MHKALLCAIVSLVFFAGPSQAQTLAQGFARPPADARPLVRWWWFGPNVEDREIVREIRAMKAGGFGGFELQTVYPLRLDGNVPFLSADHLRAIHLANETALAEGLRVDMTLGSGWPFGGPHIPVDLASTGVKLVLRPADAALVDLPVLRPGEHVMASFVGADMASARPVEPEGDCVAVPAADRGKTLFVVLQSPTGQQVKRAAMGAEGNVLDHMNAAAVQAHLASVGDTLMRAFGDRPPTAVFSDSLEVYGADWTGDLLAEFRKRRGYDLKPHLLDLFRDGPQSAAIRHDWGLTLSELTDERYLSTVTDWAHRHGTKFRSQSYGTPPVTLSSNRVVDFPEGEGARWRVFTPARWASSANHIYGQPVTSAESWTWLHAGAFQATPLDIKAEADVLMLEGVNQFVAHGWPYSPPSAPAPGWTFYAAAVFSDHNPWWPVLADVNRYLQRMSYLLRQGTPVTDVAVFLPEDDAFAAMTPGHASISDAMRQRVSETLTGQILDAGFNFDYVDNRTVLDKGLAYKVLILPHVSRVAPGVLAWIAAFAQAGGIVIAVDKAPDSAPGLMNATSGGERVSTLSRQIFTQGHNRVVGASKLGQALRDDIAPDLADVPPQLGFLHRRLPHGDLYFVANTSNQTVTAVPRFRDRRGPAQWWDAVSGSAHPWHGGSLTLAPYETRVFVFGGDAVAPITPSPEQTRRSLVLAKGWSIAFGGGPKRPLKSFVSWTQMPGRQHYSGVVTYSCRLMLNRGDIIGGVTTLDFGLGQTVAPSAVHQDGTRALLTSPLHEAAEVFVNGKRAGAVWAAPFTISLRGLVHPGKNRLEIRVGNTAVNLLAGRPAPDYSALNAKYGERFRPQNMSKLSPLPSGLLSPPKLISRL
jgi:hypothetical protein